MGLFSKQCSNPECGETVKRSARFCGACRTPVRSGWRKCGHCRTRVSVAASFCPNCRADLQPEARDTIANGRWEKPGDLLAQSIEVKNLDRLLDKKGFSIREGTGAILLDAGAVKDVLGPGTFTPDSALRKLNHWGSPPSRSLILFDLSEFVIPLEADNLRSADDLEIDAYAEIALRIDPGRAADFVANLYKEADRMTYLELGERFALELRSVFEDAANSSTVEDLVKDPLRRLRLEDRIREQLQPGLSASGIELVRVVGVEFDSPAYETIRKESGDLEARRREFELKQRAREALQSESLHAAKTQADLEEYLEQLAHERGLQKEALTHEMALLRQARDQEIELADLAHQMQTEQDQLAHNIGLEREWADYQREHALAEAQAKSERMEIDRSERVREAETEAVIDKIRDDQQHDSLEKKLALKEKQDAMRNKSESAALERELGRMQALDQVSLETKLATTDDPVLREHLLEALRIRFGVRPDRDEPETPTNFV